MKARWQVVVVLATVAWASGADGALAQEEHWRLRVSGVGAQSTGGGSDPALGFGLGLEYRLSPRIGIEVGGLTAESEGEGTIDLGFYSPTIQSSYRISPLLAGLSVHFAPGQRVDFYGGPVAGHVAVSDVTLRLPICEVCAVVPQDVRLETKDQLTWGAALGLDVMLGQRGSLLTLGVTYLRLPLEIGDGPGDVFGSFLHDVDPLLVHLGYGVRF